jgi:hypothetical protein
MKKALATRNLLNIFPSWSEIRKNWQSVGAQFLDTIGIHFDDADIYLEKMRRNSFLSTINLDEVDWVYKVQLPASFSFSLDTTDALQPVYSAPTVRGLVANNIHSGYMDISLADRNSLEEMWYNAIPSRVDLEENVTGYDSLLHWPATDFPYSGQLSHHLSEGGRLWVETTSGTQYITINDDDGSVDRGSIKLTGKTRKGTKETETMVFPWDMKQPTKKEWKYITNVEVQNLEDEVSVEIRSADYNWGPYWSFYNMRWSSLGTKIDLAVQPFTNRAWIVDSSYLHCFSLEETMVSGVDFLIGRSAGSHVKLELSDDYYAYGDDIAFTPLHVRPVSSIDKYRVWYKTPSGTKYGLDQGSQVAFTADFWQYPTELKRELEGEIFISAAERGEYNISLEAVYPDGTTHTDRLIVPIKYKQPLSSIDISSHISGSILGIDFDSDQYLWVKTTVAYYRFSLHADLMIVDYSDKIIYFREDYAKVDIS